MHPHTCPSARNYNRALDPRMAMHPSPWFSRAPTSLRVDYRAMNVHCRKDTRKGDWKKIQPANGIEVRTSALASMCLADDDRAGSQLCPGMPTSPPQDRMTTNPLSLYASFLGFQAQHAESGNDEAIII